MHFARGSVVSDLQNVHRVGGGGFPACGSVYRVCDSTIYGIMRHSYRGFFDIASRGLIN